MSLAAAYDAGLKLAMVEFGLKKQADAAILAQRLQRLFTDLPISVMPLVGGSLGFLGGSLRRRSPARAALHVGLTGTAAGLGASLGGRAAAVLDRAALQQLASRDAANIAARLGVPHPKWSPTQRLLIRLGESPRLRALMFGLGALGPAVLGGLGASRLADAIGWE